ncbi:hypothetical protein FPHYL_6985 [Fusarium phyllophilum]|uniref:Uncharacterized protein n=1 Tax=Fusarium phyllophilum TaxID=47803 RepID=A0A8H5NCC9_9HYPO|nr:hypothetical protein FPHYL_6985 [Fusarium phyllophilum]
MARSIALAVLLLPLPIAAQPEITSTPAATAAAPVSSDISFTDTVPSAPETTEYTVVSTITRSNGIDYYAVPISKSNGTATGSAPSATVDVNNAGAGLMVGTAGAVAGVVGALAIFL